jgi:uncharacterized protein YjbI with pentapeptide repeats
MANEGHIAILEQGVDAWNEWRSTHPEIKPNLQGLRLSSFINFRRASRTGAKSSEVIDFTGANFREANLCGVSFKPISARGQYYCIAGLTNVDLTEADLRGADFTYADLRGAILIDADLSGANLEDADLRNANLSKAFLKKAIVLKADLQGAILTGACIEDWHINNNTKFSGVICDYIYKYAICPLGTPDFAPRSIRLARGGYRPHSGIFKPGEFSTICQESVETIDLLFQDGIDWKAFTVSFHKIQVENEVARLDIQSIEKKGNGAILIKVSSSPEANKGKMHGDIMQLYEFFRPIFEAQYQATLKGKDQYINQLVILLYHAQEKLGEVPKQMPEKPGIQQIFYGNPGSVAGNVEGDQKTIQHNYAPEQNQTLAEAAAEIQQLLKQLEQTNPSATEADQTAFLTAVIPATKRQRFANALREGGKELLKELMDNMYLNVAIATIEGWQSAENTQPNNP